MSSVVSANDYRYLIFEVYSHYGCDGATITEIKLYDSNNNLLSYTPVNAYDSVQDGVPHYWDNDLWDKSNLNDNSVTYTSNSDGRLSTTIFMYSSPPNSSSWTRFVLDLGSPKEINKIEVWAGSPEERIPHYISIYGSNSYETSNFQQRNNEGLTLLYIISFIGNELSVSKYDVLVYKTNILYTQPANNSVLVYGTTSTTLRVSTNFNAICRYSTSPGQAFSSMTSFTNTGGTLHNTTISGLVNGGDYDYYIKCQNADNASDITEDYHLHFIVSNETCPGIVSYWTFDNDNVSGSTIIDMFGNNNGINHGAVSTTGRINQGFVFNGSNYVSLPDSTSLNYIKTGFTALAWIKLNSVDAPQTIISRYDPSSSSRFWFLQTDPTYPDEVRFYIYKDRTDAGGERISFTTSSANLQPDKWYNIAAVWDGSSSKVRIYINGVNQSGTVGGWGYVQGISTGTLEAWIGTVKDSYGNFKDYFNGTIDEVAIFNRSFDADEIFAFYKRSINNQGYCGRQGLLPIFTNFISFPHTTNLSAVPDLTNVTNLTLETLYGMLQFPHNHSVNAKGKNLDAHIKFGDCYVSVNLSGLDYTFNATAYLLMNNSDNHCGNDRIYYAPGVYDNADAIRQHDAVCRDCIKLIADNHMVKFKVYHFSSYAIGSNANLTIYDSYENSAAQPNADIIFYANYTNKSGSHISGATCTIYFDGNTADKHNMTDNGNNYNYTYSFSSAGTHNYNITCSATNYNTLSAVDDVNVESGVVPEFSSLVCLIIILLLVFILILHNQK